MNVSNVTTEQLFVMVFYVIVAILAGVATYFHLLSASTFNDIAFVVLGLIFPTATLSKVISANTAATVANTNVVTTTSTGNPLPVNTNPNVKG